MPLFTVFFVARDSRFAHTMVEEKIEAPNVAVAIEKGKDRLYSSCDIERDNMLVLGVISGKLDIVKWDDAVLQCNACDAKYAAAHAHDMAQAANASWTHFCETLPVPA